MKKAKHIGVILDGNRRWARERDLHPWKGHEEGAKRVEEIVNWAKEAGVEELTFYTFSMQNFQRDEREVAELMRIFTTAAKRALKEVAKFKENGLRIRCIGRLDKLPEKLHSLINELMDATKDNKPYTINVCIAYGGREELTDAAQKIAEEVENGTLKASEVDQDCVAKHLYLNSDPDFIIRTGGARRTSNFLPWQSTYSEWFFPETFLPALTKEEFNAMIDEFEGRERRFGK